MRKTGQKQGQGKMKTLQWLVWKSTGRVPAEHPLKEVLFSESDEEEHDSCDDFFALPLELCNFAVTLSYLLQFVPVYDDVSTG